MLLIGQKKFCDKQIAMDIPYYDLNGEEVVGMFYEEELQMINQAEFRVEKVMKRKEDKLYVKWKGYDNLFNS